MKWISFVAIILTLVLSSNSYANESYYSPERIICNLDANNKLNCKEFNRDYLTENSTTASLANDHESVFHFVSVVAYVARIGNAIHYTYADAHGKVVKLKTVSSAIKPDLKNINSWVKYNNDIYTCDAGYRNCPITY